MEELTKLVMNNNPDSDDQEEDSNNNTTVNNNYFDSNSSSSSVGQQPMPEGEEDEEESGSGDDYSDYEEGIEEFAFPDVNNERPASNTTTTEEEESQERGLPPQQEQLVQPDVVRNVGPEESTPGLLATATEIQDETSDWPRTEALIGIRPFDQDEEDAEVEGSGNGKRRTNDDDEDEDYDEDETDIMRARKRVKNARENAERGSRRFNNYNGNLEEDSAEDGSSRYLKNRRFGKNNAIKFVSTPHGKVGILYSSSSNDDAKKDNGNGVQSSSASGSHNKDVRKDLFRGISSDLRPILTSSADSASREDRNSGGSGGKMTPVLTADGKVALLYRGASAESEKVAKKYEPIVDYTKPVTLPTPTPPVEERHASPDEDEEEEEVEERPAKENQELFRHFDSDFNARKNSEPAPDHKETPEKHNSISKDMGDSGERGQEDAMAPPPPPRLEDNNFLPILDRPLSELLGLKKHQFTHFRVTEPAPTTAIPQVNMRGKLPSNYDYDFGADYNGVGDQEMLTKTEVVNLAIVPSLTQGHNSVVAHKGNAHFRKHRPWRFEDLSNIHCAMQAVVGIAALACIFGMVGAYFKNRILDTQVPTYRL